MHFLSCSALVHGLFSQIQYFAENDAVAVIEPNANFFRVYDARSMHIRRQYDIKVSE